MENEEEQPVVATHQTMETDVEKLAKVEEKRDVVTDNHICDEEFAWEEYLEEIQAEAAPPSAFPHVEKSLESGIEENQLIEVVHYTDGDQPSGYWVAKIITVCGPLLRLRYLFPVAINVETWVEVSSGCLHPLGWGSQHSVPLSIPPEVPKELQNESFLTNAKKIAEDAEAQNHSVPEEAFDGNGYTAVDRIRLGMKVEVLYDDKPFCGWVATVLDNVGGRLHLQFDTPDCSGETFWLFYLSHRLRPIDWIYQKGSPWKYKNPTLSTFYEEAEWSALLEMSRDDARHSSLPKSLLSTSLEPDTHSFKVGMLLEAVHPFKPFSIELGIITKVTDDKYFEITMQPLNGESVSWLTSSNDPLILPTGFCKEHGLKLAPPNDWNENRDFNAEDYAKYLNLSIADSGLFREHNACGVKAFEVDHRLECVHPINTDQICFASVIKICGHLLVLKLDSESDFLPIFRSAMSQDIFPMGWCHANNYSLQLPIHFCEKVKSVESSMPVEDPQEQSRESPATIGALSLSGSQLSMWCPRLYINYCCHTGPYLSKSKVAKQSQSVGPGSVELVLREVLAMTINAAYIPTRALRELERSVKENPNIPPSWHPLVFKAKFRRYNATATIPIATIASDISDFLNLICHVLQCCPNLWSTTSTGENCPFLCNGSQICMQANPASYFRGRGRIAHCRGARGGLIYRRKRGGRKRLYVPIRTNRLLQPKSLV
ncbi:hypothetical protein SK128_027429, partial [Halocaridina rubra]